MSGKTTIEWTHAPGYVGAVWNPTTGCTRVSAGCENCYAFALHDKRYRANLDAAREHDSTLSPASARSVHALPWPKQYDLPFSRVQLLPDRLDVPLRTRKPTCYFVDSMADLFHEDVPDQYIEFVFDTMARARHHRFLILTKRPERMRLRVEALKDFREAYGAWPLPNVWLGSSVEGQKAADERIPHLLATPAAVRFLSCEPLLGPVDLRGSDEWSDALDGNHHARIDWVIVGGESGPRARAMETAWARSLVEQCKAASVPVFVKQLGSNPVGRTMGFTRHDNGFSGQWTTAPLKLREPHGRGMAEWPEDLRIREWPE